MQGELGQQVLMPAIHFLKRAELHQAACQCATRESFCKLEFILDATLFLMVAITNTDPGMLIQDQLLARFFTRNFHRPVMNLCGSKYER